jgi:tetratricopeptide (TPR) repeat protein
MQVSNDIQRARKCYEKAFSVNTDPKNDEAARALVDIYLSQDLIIEAETTLETLVQENSKCGWAWKKLGFIFIERREYVTAISAFQSSLRLDPSDTTTWQGLGDAYIFEGKYIAALKVFNRVLELDNGSMYAMFRVGVIKHRLGEYPEAIKQFEHIIEKHKLDGKNCHIPTHRSLVKSLLAYSKQCFEMGAYGRVVDHFNYALEIIHKIIDVSQNYQCIFKILADFCMIVDKVAVYTNLINTSIFDRLYNKLESINLHGTVTSVFNASQMTTSSIGQKILGMALHAYKISISLSIDAGYSTNLIASYWHDTSICCSRLSSNNAGLQDVAIQSIFVSMKLEPLSAVYWNVLGIYLLNKDPKFCQHAFIQSLELDSKVLYFIII